MTEDEFYNIVGACHVEVDLGFAPKRLRVSYAKTDGDVTPVVHAVHPDGTYEVLGMGVPVHVVEQAYQDVLAGDWQGWSPQLIVEAFKGRMLRRTAAV